jgi:hypothetical protein
MYSCYREGERKMGRRQVRERVGKKPGDVLNEFVQVLESIGDVAPWIQGADGR